MVAAVVLAAGASSRLGRPKALVPLQGEPAVVRVCRVAREAGCDETVVVVGAASAAIRAVLPDFAHAVENPMWQSGRTGSIKRGVEAVRGGTGILLWPVDHPAVQIATVHRLLGARGEIRVPLEDGKRGHPVFFGPSVRGELLALGDSQPLHDVVHAKPERVVEVPVTDEAVLLNLDTAGDLKKLEALLGGASDARPSA